MGARVYVDVLTKKDYSLSLPGDNDSFISRGGIISITLFQFSNRRKISSERGKE